MTEHRAQPLMGRDPQPVKPYTCRTCGQPVYRPRPTAAPGAWRHTKPLRAARFDRGTL